MVNAGETLYYIAGSSGPIQVYSESNDSWDEFASIIENGLVHKDCVFYLGSNELFMQIEHLPYFRTHNYKFNLDSKVTF